MIIYIYDAKAGTAIADGQVFEQIDELIRLHNTNPSESHVYVSGTENTLHALCLRVKEGRLLVDDVQIIFRRHEVGSDQPEDQPLCIYANGGIRPRPKGFADQQERTFLRILKTFQKSDSNYTKE